MQQSNEISGEVWDIGNTKFNGTLPWRRRQQLDSRIEALENAVGCLILARERKAFDSANFEFCLLEVNRAQAELMRFYHLHK